MGETELNIERELYSIEKDNESLNQGWVSGGRDEDVDWVRVKENQWDH